MCARIGAICTFLAEVCEFLTVVCAFLYELYEFLAKVYAFVAEVVSVCQSAGHSSLGPYLIETKQALNHLQYAVHHRHEAGSVTLTSYTFLAWLLLIKAALQNGQLTEVRSRQTTTPKTTTTTITTNAAHTTAMGCIVFDECLRASVLFVSACLREGTLCSSLKPFVTLTFAVAPQSCNYY